MLDVENCISFHRLLDFDTLVDGDLGVKHTHLARIHAQLNAWTGKRIDLTFINWSLYFVIVCKRGERAGLEDTNLQTGFVYIDRLSLSVVLEFVSDGLWHPEPHMARKLAAGGNTSTPPASVQVSQPVA